MNVSRGTELLERDRISYSYGFDPRGLPTLVVAINGEDDASYPAILHADFEGVRLDVRKIDSGRLPPPSQSWKIWSRPDPIARETKFEISIGREPYGVLEALQSALSAYSDSDAAEPLSVQIKINDVALPEAAAAPRWSRAVFLDAVRHAILSRLHDDAGARPGPDQVPGTADAIKGGIVRERAAVDRVAEATLTGWFTHLDFPGWPQLVSVTLEGVPLPDVTAELHRVDLIGALSNANAGFSIDLATLPPEIIQSLIAALRASEAGRADRPLRVDLLGDEMAEPFVRYAPCSDRNALIERLGAVLAVPAAAPVADVPPDEATFPQSDLALERIQQRLSDISQELEKRTREAASATNQIALKNKQLEQLRQDNEALARSIARIERTAVAHEAKALALERERDAARAMRRNERRMLCSVTTALASGRAVAPTQQNQTRQAITYLTATMLADDIARSPDVPQQRKDEAAEIAIYFDPAFYVLSNPAPIEAGYNPLLHYLQAAGDGLGSPNPLFDEVYYRRQAGPTGQCGLLHYVRTGAAAGLRPSPLFDPAWYAARHAAARASDLEPLLHFLIEGAQLKLDPCRLFDTEFVLQQLGSDDGVDNALIAFFDLDEETQVDPHPLVSLKHLAAQMSRPGQQALLDWLRDPDLQFRFGCHPLVDPASLHKDGRFAPDPTQSLIEQYLAHSETDDIDPHPLFQSKLYRHQVEIEHEEALSVAPVVHYCREGHRRSELVPNPLFSPAVYEKELGEPPSAPHLVHYLISGETAGIRCHEVFSPAIYRAQDGWSDDFGSPLVHCLTSAADQRLISDSRLKQPLTDIVLDFIRHVSERDDELDTAFYRQTNVDLAHLSDDELVRHYVNAGQSEGRPGSPAAMLKKKKLGVADLPIGFYPEEYRTLNPDLKALPEDSTVLLSHYLQFGHGENRLVALWQLQHATPQPSPLPATSTRRISKHASDVRVAIMIHIFYDDLWPELAAYANNFADEPHDVFVNVVDIAWTPQFQMELRRLCPNAFVQLSNDSGRDIGGFMRLFDNVDLDRYKYTAMIHSKKSPHIATERATSWRRCLLNAFAGSPEIVHRSLATLEEDPRMGMVAAKEWRARDMGNNQALYEKMLDEFDITGKNRDVDYCSGTMFLLRTDIIERLYTGLQHVNWEYGGDKDVDFHMDGQIAHAVERVIPPLARQMGYDVSWV